MKQIITKDGKVYCITSVPYHAEVIKQMKKAGYKVKEVNNGGANKKAHQ